MMRRFALCAWLAVVLANASCTAPTQVILEIDAEEGLRAEISSVRLQMESTNEPFTAPEDRPFSPRQWPFTTVLAPLNRDATRRYRVQATATTPGGLIVARATSGFAPGRSWTLRLRFERSCLDVDCEAERTCRRGSCVSAAEPVEGVEDGGVDAGGVDAPMSFDARPADAFVPHDAFVAPDATCESSERCGTPSCRDLNTDPDHCGVCGNRCAWGRCVGGSCDDPIEISVGTFHTCAVREFGEVVCWGLNGRGQLAQDPGTPETPRTQYLSRPTLVSLTGVTHVATGESHTCATTATGVSCWGYNSAGQLGNNTTVDSFVPMPVAGAPATASGIAAGLRHTCMASGPAIHCWGSNSEYQGGGSSTSNQLIPQIVADLPTTAGSVSTIVAGNQYNCALYLDGSLWCWGSNSHGQLGRGVGSSRATPLPATSLPSATSVATSFQTTCASSDDGIRCWGSGNYGTLGDGLGTNRTTPELVTTSLTGGVLNMSGTAGTMCAQLSGNAFCWGDNSTLQAGVGSGSRVLSPTQVSNTTGLTGVVEVRAGGSHSCARVMSGDVFCWGANEYGQLGNGSTSFPPTAVPTRVLPPL